MPHAIIHLSDLKRTTMKKKLSFRKWIEKKVISILGNIYKNISKVLSFLKPTIKSDKDLKNIEL